jgi:hypothetical protein
MHAPMPNTCVHEGPALINIPFSAEGTATVESVYKEVEVECGRGSLVFNSNISDTGRLALKYGGRILDRLTEGETLLCNLGNGLKCRSVIELFICTA